MNKPSLNQVSTMVDVLKNLDWVKTQFGEEDLGPRLFKVLNTISMWDYEGIKIGRKYRESNRIRKILINNGLKPVIPDYRKNDNITQKNADTL